MAALLASVFVSLTSTFLFSRWQSRKFREAYGKRLDHEERFGNELGYGVGAEAIGSWFDRGIDFAANFPSFILLLVALSEFGAFQSRIAAGILIVVAAAGGAAFLIYGEPAGKPMWSKWGVSVIGWAIILANFALVIVVILNDRLTY